jgi:hypothetical protein
MHRSILYREGTWRRVSLPVFRKVCPNSRPTKASLS